MLTALLTAYALFICYLFSQQVIDLRICLESQLKCVVPSRISSTHNSLIPSPCNKDRLGHALKLVFLTADKLWGAIHYEKAWRRGPHNLTSCPLLQQVKFIILVLPLEEFCDLSYTGGLVCNASEISRTAQSFWYYCVYLRMSYHWSVKLSGVLNRHFAKMVSKNYT